MPKLKTRKAVKKRFRFTGKGRIKRSRPGKRHILTKKSGKRKMNLRKSGLVSKTQERTVKRMMPYG